MTTCAEYAIQIAAKLAYLERQGENLSPQAALKFHLRYLALVTEAERDCPGVTYPMLGFDQDGHLEQYHAEFPRVEMRQP